jgi:hypothetical protein
MEKMRFAWMRRNQEMLIVSMPEDHMYQLTALHVRLHKEIDKLTAFDKPALATVIAECAELEILDPSITMIGGYTYLTALEQQFAAISEKRYPLISLLTEIRALHAQMEQWEEEQADLV